jgi:hypothetical protein
LAIAGTAIPVLKRGHCSTRRAKNGCAKLFLRRLRRAEGCGVGRRWRVGSRRKPGCTGYMPSGDGST